MSSKRKSPPAQTLQERENQLISLAENLAERQLREGTASAMVISHYLKLASSRERIEKEILQKQKELLMVKTESLQSQKRTEELYQRALDAMGIYSGNGGAREEDI